MMRSRTSLNSLLIMIISIFSCIELCKYRKKLIHLENIEYDWNYFEIEESSDKIVLGSKTYDQNLIGSAANIRDEQVHNLDEIITVPEEINQKQIISLQNYCFARWTMKEISLPKNIHGKIPDGCFSCCENLIRITLPSGANTVCAHAFDHCKSLEKLVIQSFTVKFVKHSIINCQNLSSIEYNGHNKIETEEESIVNVSSSFHFLVTFDYDTESNRSKYRIVKRRSPKLHAVTYTRQGDKFIVSGSGDVTQDNINSNKGTATDYAEIILNGTDPSSLLRLKKNGGSTKIFPDFTNVVLVSFYGNVGTEYQGFKQHNSIRKAYIAPDSTVDLGASTFYECSGLREVVILSNIKMGNWLFGSVNNLAVFYCGTVSPPLTQVHT